MAFIDYYKILGVDKNIPQKDVRAAYRKRAKQFHPDLHPDDPKAKAKFQALTEAYEVIGDPDKRAKYDKYGEQWRQADGFGGAGAGDFGSAGGGNPFAGFDFGGFSGGGFSSFFQDLFGGGSKGNPFSGFSSGANQQPVDNGNIEQVIRLSIYTALMGGEILVRLPNGKKAKLKVKPSTQPGTKVRLRGKGRVGSNGQTGDLILIYQIHLPEKLNEKQIELLNQMKEAGA